MPIKYLGFDCAYFCWRAFHSTGSLEFEGQPTGVLHGFLSQLLIMARQFGINEPLFFWDSRKRLRHKILPSYKEKGEKTEEEIKEFQKVYKQMNDLRNNILPVMGFNNCFLQTGLEADDLIAKFVRDNPGTTVVLSNDEDLWQLTDDCVWHSPSRRMTINEKAFRDAHNMHPKKWRRVKQIAGCNSDKVPGVAGIGNVYAAQYLRGELKPGKTLDKIIAPEARALAKFNRPLVALPFKGTQGITLQTDKFDIDGFLAVCDMYGLHKLAAESGDWENTFR